MDPTECPNRSELSQFATGDLPPAAFERVAGHVEGCPLCERALAELDGRSDPIATQLRQPVVSEENGSTVLHEVLQALGSVVAGRDTPAGLLAGEGRRLGKFELLEELGAGSFGQVFRALDVELDRAVAIKVLRAGRTAGRDEVDRFLREARSVAHLRHPGIVTLHDSGVAEDGTLYLVEEFIPGTTLEVRLRHNRPGYREAAELAAAVADALGCAHEAGIIHRDVKPANILLDAEGRPHVTDFGLAKRDADEVSVTMTGEVLGTPAYMSPEQACGESHQVDARSDVYALGVILYELLTGDRPFRGNRRMLLRQVLQDEPRPPRQLNDRVPRDLETICLKAMAKTPARRYPTAGELADDLRRWLAGEPIRARPVGTAERLGRWCRRNPLAASLFLAVTLGAAFGMGYLSWLSEQLVRSTARDGAAQQAEMMEEAHNYFSVIVDEIKHQGYEVTHDPRTKGRAKGVIDVVVPARFAINLGQQIGDKSASGVQVRLYSNYPFRSRRDGGPQDDFGKEALAYLNDHPDEAFWRFADHEGRPVVRYAIARRMQATCIDCHNSHPDSTRHDWKVGDMRGVLEIIRPLDRDVARTRAGLQGTFALVAGVSASLLALSVLVLVAGNRRRVQALAAARDG